jgi:hypothetical protein
MPCTIAMMKRCRVTSTCESPSTSVSHGVAPASLCGRQTRIPLAMTDLAASHEIRCGVGRSTEQIAQVARGSLSSTSISGSTSPFRILLLWAQAV